jgi:hypothetical protein
MQYIQFQPLNSSQIPNSPSGAINLFVDSTDNSVKIKDTNGNTFSCSYTVVNKTQMDSLIASSSLNPGNFYKITGVDTNLYAGTDIILQATSPNTLSKGGWGLFYTPNYNLYNVWSNVDRVNIGSTTGFFQFSESIHGDQGQTGDLIQVPGSSTMTFVNTGGNWGTTTNIYGDYSGAYAQFTGYISQASYTVGQKVIWGGFVWQNLIGGVGNTPLGWPYTQIQLDNTNWTFVPYNTTDYTLVCDVIEYQYEYDNISYRKNETNEVFSDFNWFSNAWGYNNINRFPWGNPNVLNVSIKNSYLDSLINFPNQNNNLIKNVSFDNGGGFNAHTWGIGTQITNITSDKGGHMVSMNLGDNTQIDNINLKQYAFFNSIYTSNNDINYNQINNIEVGQYSNFQDIYIYPYSNISFINLNTGCNFEYVYIFPSSNITSVNVDIYGSFEYINLGVNSSIADVYVGSESTFGGILGNYDCNFTSIDLLSNSFLGNIYFNAVGNTIVDVKISSGGAVENIYFNDNYSQIFGIDISPFGQLNSITFGSSAYISYVNIGTTSLNNILLNSNSTIEYSTFENNCIFQNIILDNSVILQNIKIQVGAAINGVAFSSSLNGAYVSLESSTFPATIDISNLSNIDLGSYNYAGIITFTSTNSTETITNMVNGANFPQKFEAATGLTVTFQGTPVGSVTSGGQLLMPTSTFVLNGTNYDFITFDTVFNGTYTLERQIAATNNL